MEKAKGKVKKGWLAVELLDKAYEVYGYHTKGPLKLPCSVDDFLNLKWQIEKESNHHHHHHHHHHLPLTLPFHSC
ncbi:hypothetical protein ES288_A05G428400v1 [Gossypium darwinii]|uniref:Uncharacterized protein n=1 Tax=Gossypium darwinii TaxID=34276 RepID=A0A5D2GQR4_GOSDA|nr:hypothetical protein ES288_A05G428400v1 [Gossypium darwinii]